MILILLSFCLEEDGTAEALDVLRRCQLSAPDLLVAECSNILWKKVRRSELHEDEAAIAAGLLQRADIDLLPTRNLMQHALELALRMDHAAYDCIYLSLAIVNDWPLVTADERLRRKATGFSDLRMSVLSMTEAIRLD